MLYGSRRTFAAVAVILGVTEERVAYLVDHGPLVARLQADGSRLIYDEDLAAFRRPRFRIAESEIGGLLSVMSTPPSELTAPPAPEAAVPAAEQQVATEQAHPVAADEPGAEGATLANRLPAARRHLRLVRP